MFVHVESEPLELELRPLVNCLIWVLGMEVGSSGVAVYILSHRAVFPASHLILYCGPIVTHCMMNHSSLTPSPGGHWGISSTALSG